MPTDKEFDPQVIATTMMGCVQQTFETMCSVTFSQNPEFLKKNIIEYGSRIRIFGLEKFNGPCYVSALNFYATKKDFQTKNAIGAMILYVDDAIVGKLVKAFGQTGFDEDDEDTVLDVCGEFCNVIAGQFKNDLRGLGYLDLTISAPTKHKNEIPEGVDFNYNETTYYELNFYLWGRKALVVDISMAPVPHA